MRPRTLTLAALSALSTLALSVACDRGATAGRDESGSYALGSAAAPPPPPAPAPLPPMADAAANVAVPQREAFAGAAAEQALATRSATAGVAGGASAQPATAPASAVAPAERFETAYIIRTGSASIQVDSLEPAVAALRAVATRWGGWVANASISGGKEQMRTATLEIKVPSSRFDSLVTSLSPIGTVEGINVAAEDVGEEFVDVTARVANARRLEARLVDLLERRTARLSDMLSVERELARVREEIERYDGRLRYLRARVAVSTLTVNVHEPPPLVASRPGEHRIADAFRQAGRNFIGLVAAVIAASGVLVPVGAVAAGIFVAVRRARRRHQVEKPASA